MNQLFKNKPKVIFSILCAFVVVSIFQFSLSNKGGSTYSSAGFGDVFFGNNVEVSNKKPKPTTMDAKLLYRLVKVASSLSKMNIEGRLLNDKMILAIESKAVEDGRIESLMCLDEINRVISRGKELSKIVVDISNQLIIASGGRDEKGTPVGVLDKKVANRILVGSGKGTQLGRQFEWKLDEISRTINKCQKTISPLINGNPKKYQILNLTESGDESRLSQKHEKLKEENEFLNLMFGDATLIEALVMLRQKEAESLAIERELIKSVRDIWSSNTLKFDTEFPLISAASKTVEAGGKYHAKLFLTRASNDENVQIKYFINNKEVTEGQVSFPVSWGGGTPLKGQPNIMRKTWKGKIEIADNTGRVITTYQENFEYFVTKPKLTITTSNSNVLYEECKNKVRINGLGSGDFTYSAFGGKVILSKLKGEVFLVPRQNTSLMTLKILKDSKPFSEEKFSVYKVPTPRFVVYKEGRPVDLKIGSACPSKITVKSIIDDKYFTTFYPEGINYIPSSGTVQLVRGRRPVAGAVSIVKEEIDLSSFSSFARPGDRLLLEVREVERVNALGEKVIRSIGRVEGMMNIPISQ